jgi:hypothetical protein
MSDKINDGGPAFPCEQSVDSQGNWNQTFEGGMSLREYAAINLRVPKSGTPWLDEMITESLHNDFAAKAMHGGLASRSRDSGEYFSELAKRSYYIAKEMLMAREG